MVWLGQRPEWNAADVQQAGGGVQRQQRRIERPAAGRRSRRRTAAAGRLLGLHVLPAGAARTQRVHLQADDRRLAQRRPAQHADDDARRADARPVSYTHLTLPTIYSV